MKTKEEARAQLLSALPHFRLAMSEAMKLGSAGIGIMAINQDGSGTVTAKFQAPEFFEDLAIVLDAPEETEDDRMDARAAKLLSMIGPGQVIRDEEFK